MQILPFDTSFPGNTNIYEVNIRQYTAEGTFAAFQQHLPRLKDMGVDILWLMPIYPIGKINRKGSLGSYYSISDFEALNPEFGDEKDFAALVRCLHENRMKIIIDWVANHAAHDHVWTVSHPEYFVKQESGGFLSPYDWTDVIQINHESYEQQEAMIMAMRYWINAFDIDGFRADLAHLTPLPFWIKARKHLQTIKKDLIWLAETEEPSYHQAFDISFTWQWMHACEKFCARQISLPELMSVLEMGRASFSADAYRLYFTGNHDENSWNGTEFEKYGKAAHALAVFSCLYASIPLVYSGQEIPNCKRLPFFEKETLDWSDKPALHDFYRRLLHLRKTHPALANNVSGMDIPIYVGHEGYLIFFRTHEREVIMVMLNLASQSIECEYKHVFCEGMFRDLFSDCQIELKGSCYINLGPGGYRVLIKK